MYYLEESPRFNSLLFLHFLNLYLPSDVPILERLEGIAWELSKLGNSSVPLRFNVVCDPLSLRPNFSVFLSACLFSLF
jgi:hypothetical protein